MGLSHPEIAAVKAAALEVFGPDAQVRLFGSRTNGALRGGDIDLLIEVAPGQAGFDHEHRFLEALFRRIDERKADVLLMARGADPSPIESIALRDGVPL